MTDITPKKEFIEFIEEHADCEKFKLRIHHIDVGRGMDESKVPALKGMCDHDGLRMEIDA